MIGRILLFLGILKEVPQEIQPKEVFDKILHDESIIKQLHHQKIEISEEELQRQEKKKIIGSGNMRNMFEGYERCLLRKKLPKITIPENDPKLHFRGDMDRALKMNKEQVDLERGKRYIANVEYVLSRNKKMRGI